MRFTPQYIQVLKLDVLRLYNSVIKNAYMVTMHDLIGEVLRLKIHCWEKIKGILLLQLGWFVTG